VKRPPGTKASPAFIYLHTAPLLCIFLFSLDPDRASSFRSIPFLPSSHPHYLSSSSHRRRQRGRPATKRARPGEPPPGTGAGGSSDDTPPPMTGAGGGPVRRDCPARARRGREGWSSTGARWGGMGGARAVGRERLEQSSIGARGGVRAERGRIKDGRPPRRRCGRLRPSRRRRGQAQRVVASHGPARPALAGSGGRRGRRPATPGGGLARLSFFFLFFSNMYI